MIGFVSAVLAASALAQAPAGTAEVTADGCKLYLPQSEARGASRIRWSGKCVDGYGDGRGVVRIYQSGKISRVAEATFTAGKITAPGESYSIRSGQAIRSRGAEQLEVSAAELPTWALELSLLVEDKPVRPAPKPVAAAPKVDKAAEQQKLAAEKAAAEAAQRQAEAKAAADKAAADRARAMAEAKTAAEEAARQKAAAEAKLAQERERAAAEAKAAADAAAAKAAAEAKAAADAQAAAERAKAAIYVPGRGFADGGAGEPMRGVVSFKLANGEGREFGIATFVAGKGEAEIKQNAQALATVYEKVSPFQAKLVEQPDVASVCGGPGYVVEARVTYPSAKSYGWYAGCMSDDVEKVAKSMQQLEEQMHRDFKVSATSFWAYQYLIVGYVDATTMRGRADYERVARPGLMAPGRVMVLSRPDQWAECSGMLTKDPKLKDKAGCLREAIDKLKGTLGLR